jgi:hypothetical protein
MLGFNSYHPAFKHQEASNPAAHIGTNIKAQVTFIHELAVKFPHL